MSEKINIDLKVTPSHLKVLRPLAERVVATGILAYCVWISSCPTDGDHLGISIHAHSGRRSAHRSIYVRFDGSDALVWTSLPLYRHGKLRPLQGADALVRLVETAQRAAATSAKRMATATASATKARASQAAATVARVAALAKRHAFAYVTDVRAASVLVTVRLGAACIYEVDVPHKAAATVLRDLPAMVKTARTAHALGVFHRVRRLSGRVWRRRWLGRTTP